MDLLAGSFSKALDGVSGCFRGDADDPDLSPSVSGPILHNDQLKSFQDGGPRYVIAVGSPPCSRSTVDMCPHHDALLPFYLSTAPSPWVSLCPPLESSGCAGIADNWFPEFTCSPKHADDKHKERLMIHCRGYGQPWHLLGHSLPPAKVLRCVRYCDPSVSGVDRNNRLRFWRDGGHVTVMQTLEEEWGEDPYGEWPPEEEYNIILFENDSGNYGTYPDSTVTLLNRRLAEDPHWQALKTVVRNEIDPCFGKYEEFLSVVFSVDPQTESISRCGMGVVYCGRRNDDVACAVVQLVSYANAVSSFYHDHETSCEHGMCSGRNSFMSGVFESSVQSKRNSGPPQLPERVSSPHVDKCRPSPYTRQKARDKGKDGESGGDGMVADADADADGRTVGEKEDVDPYGWRAASRGTGLGLDAAGQYQVSVKPALCLRLGVDISPTHRLLSEAYEKVRSSVVRRGIGLFRSRGDPIDRQTQSPSDDKYRYSPSNGCGCDLDDAFVANTSARLRGETKWMLGAMKEMNEGGVLAPSDGTADESQKAYTWGGRIAAKDAPCHWLFWFVVVAGGWVSRIPATSGESHGAETGESLSEQHSPPKKRAKYRVRESTPQVFNCGTFPRSFMTFRRNSGGSFQSRGITVERRVARSSMSPWTSRTVQSMAGGRKFIDRRGHKRGRRGSSCPFVLLDRTAGHSWLRHHSLMRLWNNSTETHEECCMLLFVGDSMLCTLRCFFSLDDTNSEAFVEEIADMVKNIAVANSPCEQVCRYPQGTTRTTPFAFVLAAVCCNTVTGARNCAQVRVAYGGVTTRPEAVYYAGQRVREMCQESSVAGIYHMRTVAAVPEVGHVPLRFILSFDHGPSDYGTPRVVSCKYFSTMPLPREEALMLGSSQAWRVPDQDSFCKALSFCGVQPPAGDCCLGLFFPLKGMRMLTAENKRRAGEYCQRFWKWFQWGKGAPHYGALRKLVPLCSSYLSDVGIAANFFGFGLLVHLHCMPEPEREKLVVAVLSRALCDAQKFADSSLYVDVKNL